MREVAKELGYPFPYLYDETQQVAMAYQAACTPDFYIFDRNLKCVYRGQLDDSRPGNGLPVTGKDLRAALDNILQGKPVNTNQKPSVGCNIKWKNEISGPHQGQPILAAGEPLEHAGAAMVMIHGRGATAESILTLADEFDQPGFSYLAPQAAGGTWYPNRFLAPTQTNEPWLSSALAAVEAVVKKIVAIGIPHERLIILGFSQGACLALEYAARHARRYGGIVGLSGGLIGADGEPRQDNGNFAGTPIFLGCSEVDFHIPQYRVEHAAKILTDLGGKVTMRLYPNMDHTVNQDEIEFVRGMMAALAAP